MKSSSGRASSYMVARKIVQRVAWSSVHGVFSLLALHWSNVEQVLPFVRVYNLAMVERHGRRPMPQASHGRTSQSCAHVLHNFPRIVSKMPEQRWRRGLRASRGIPCPSFVTQRASEAASQQLKSQEKLSELILFRRLRICCFDMCYLLYSVD